MVKFSVSFSQKPTSSNPGNTCKTRKTIPTTLTLGYFGDIVCWFPAKKVVWVNGFPFSCHRISKNNILYIRLFFEPFVRRLFQYSPKHHVISHSHFGMCALISAGISQWLFPNRYLHTSGIWASPHTSLSSPFMPARISPTDSLLAVGTCILGWSVVLVHVLALGQEWCAIKKSQRYGTPKNFMLHLQREICLDLVRS